ncbi:hypothetical protein CYMTET_33229 [Cymbomonas tetramitiformis]|uniref:Major facilitator superfamily (MFS) profile domain-containing protein n=1 Tax=Cymbomonas tetramitiformis TaxID=36881 RepID=A0AAE0FDI7_9CHLO|nr:hypothetical protein CYMTET_33229 [Cymbomonas tetramitiformis]
MIATSSPVASIVKTPLWFQRPLATPRPACGLHSRGGSARRSFSQPSESPERTLLFAKRRIASNSRSMLASERKASNNNPQCSEQSEVLLSDREQPGNSQVGYELDEWIDGARWGRFQVRHFCAMAFNWLIGGAQVLSTVFIDTEKGIGSEWNLQPWELSLVGSVFFAGWFVGSTCTGILGDKFGRRKCFIFSWLMFNTCATLSGLAPAYACYLPIRFAMGFATASTGMISFVHGVEMFGAQYRTMLGFWFNVVFSIGTISLCILAAVLHQQHLPNSAWRQLAFLVAIPGWLAVFTFPTLSESPRWLLSKNRGSEGSTTLEFGQPAEVAVWALALL